MATDIDLQAAERSFLDAVGLREMLAEQLQRATDALAAEHDRVTQLQRLIDDFGDEGLGESDPIAAAEVGSARLRRKLANAPARIEVAASELAQVTARYDAAVAEADSLSAGFVSTP